MGNCCPVIHVRLPRRSSGVNRKSITLLMVGLDGAGKTTVVKRLSSEPLHTVVPTVGFSTVNLEQKACTVTLYDLGGRAQIRGIWPRYFVDAHGFIFVVDATDGERVEECRTTLEEMLSHDAVAGKPILLLANKQDVEGALDEIDIVEKLNIEPLVNRQKCPTLVELCAARHFSKKLDIGIDNGYKWLIRCIVKDYPALNNRVLMDLARQAEQDRIEVAAREERVRKIREAKGAEEMDKKIHQNGVAKHLEPVERVQPTLTRLPGLVDDDGETSSSSGMGRTRDSEFSRVLKTSESNAELLKYVESAPERNFLVRPKSSGAKLYPTKSDHDTKRPKKRRKVKKGNKTGPSPFTDIAGEPGGALPKVFDPAYYTEVSVIGDGLEAGEGEPGVTPPEPNLDMFRARRNGDVARPLAFERRKSLPEGQAGCQLDVFTVQTSRSTPNSGKKLPPLQVNGRLRAPPLVLDARQLDDML